MTTEFPLGATVRIQVTITDSGGDLADPSTTVIKINKPDGSNAVSDAAMSQLSAGVYYYDYQLSEETTGLLGVYSYRIKATGAGGRVTPKHGEFKAVVSI